MKAALLNTPLPLPLSNPSSSPIAFPSRHTIRLARFPSHISFSINPAASFSPKPIVIVGSANADIYVEIDRLPLEGETISARSGRTLPGGKGANQAFCSGRLSRSDNSTYLIGRVGSDAHGRLLEDSLGEGGAVRLDRLTRADYVPTGDDFSPYLNRPVGEVLLKARRVHLLVSYSLLFFCTVS
jgi:ribokinase